MKRILLFVVFSAVLLSLWGCNGKPEARPFITKWQGKAGQELKIPILGTYTLTWYNEATPEDRHTEQVTITAYMGENGFEETTPYILIPPTDGIYVVEAGPEGVEGMLMSFENSFEYGHTLLTVVQFGDVVWKRLNRAFFTCSNMRFEEGIDTPNLSQCTSLSGMFWGCKAFNSPLAQWDVSKITNMEDMFHDCETFNQPLDSWDVGRVTLMGGMFVGCSHFNQPLARWDVSQVTNMSAMFSGCTLFNQSLEAWKINPLARTDGMQAMFYGSPAAELPFVAKWREEGCQLDYIEEEFVPEAADFEEEMEEQ